MGLAGNILLGIAGWVSGALINLLADQLPTRRKTGKIYCAYCNAPRSIIEFLLLERCKACAAPRNARSHIMQIFLTITFIFIKQWNPDRLLLIEGLVLLVFFTLVFVIDLEHRLILHPISIAGAVISAIIGWRLHGPLITVVGGAAGFGIMLLLYYFGELFAKVMAKRRGEPIDEVALGFGDVNLSGILGLLLGWPGITAGLILAILFGGVVSAAVMGFMVIKKSYHAYMALPYAPFLILAAVVLLLRS